MKNSPLIPELKPSSTMMQSLSKLFYSLKNQRDFDKSKTIVITSSLPREGKSTITANLALMYAMNQRRVLVIDGNLESPRMHEIFGIPNEKGLMDLLEQESLLDFYTLLNEAFQLLSNEKMLKSFLESQTIWDYSSFIRSTSYTGVSVMTTGANQQSLMSKLHLLSTDNFRLLLKTVMSTYDIVLIDGPSVEFAVELEVLTTLADGLLLVVEYDKVKRKKFKSTIEQINQFQAPIIGTVLNKYSEGDARLLSQLRELFSLKSFKRARQKR